MIEDYKRRNQGDIFWSKFTPESCTWQQVHDELERSETEYRHKGVVNRLRRAVRSGGLPGLAPLVEAIPEDDGLGLLKAGIIILVNVCPIFKWNLKQGIAVKSGLTHPTGGQKTITSLRQNL